MGSPGLLGVALCWLLACQGPSQAPSTVRIGHEADVFSLDPVAVSEAATHSILSNVFESLATFDKDMRLVPALATGWSTPDDHTWLIRLRHGVRFHDGRTLSVEDVKASLDRARADPASAIKGQVWSLVEASVVDEDTVRLTTVRPDPLLMSRLTYVWIAPRAGSAALASHPVGTGPYRFVRWEKGRFLEVEAFPGYWGQRPSVDRAVFVPVEQGEGSLAALKQGAVDVLRELPETLLGQAAALPGIRVLARPGLASNYLWINALPRMGSKANPFADRRVRRALALAIDRAKMVKTLGGHGLAADQLLPQGVFGHVERLRGLPNDPAEARRLLEEAGYRGGFEATLTYSSGISAQATAEMVRDMAAGAGIRLRLELLEWPTLIARWKAAQLPLFLSGWRVENGDATSFLRDCLYTRDASRGYGAFNPGFSSPALDRLVDENDQIFDDGKRRRHYEMLMRLVLDEVPLVPLYHRANLYGASQRVRFEPRLDGKLLAAEMSLHHSGSAPPR